MSGQQYRTIVADPPWAYPEGHVTNAATGRSKNRARDGAEAIGGKDVRRALPYPSMSVEAIKALPVAALATPDARLNRYLPDSFDVLAAWGFTYRQTLVWHKADGGPFPASVAPNTAEFLIVATVGRPARIGTLRSSVIRKGATKRHSAKPDCFLDDIEQISPGPYLELFARRQRFGWDVWGNEVDSDVELIA